MAKGFRETGRRLIPVYHKAPAAHFGLPGDKKRMPGYNPVLLVSNACQLLLFTRGRVGPQRGPLSTEREIWRANRGQRLVGKVFAYLVLYLK